MGVSRPAAQDESSTGKRPRRRVRTAADGTRGRVRAAALAVAASAALAACNSGSTSPASSPLGQFLRGTTAEPTTIDPKIVAPAVPCPRVRLQPSTEVLRREDAAGGQGSLRWQASIVRTARECTPTEAGVAVRVGVSGRVIEGPKGAPDVVELPLRVAVREGDSVTYSRVHNVAVTMEATSQSWAFVDDEVTIAEPERAEIVVGFDG